MLILAIETSCDETSAAVIKDGRKILSNVVASSVSLHKKTGGIIPERAAREQLKSIIPVIETAMENGKCKMENIDCIATTTGPGLIGSLLVGVETAKTLSLIWNKPLVPVNHLIGHIYANWLKPDSPTSRHPDIPYLPAIALVVSGGHTDLVLMKDHAKLEWLGGTRDDAAGEAFDKTARLLGLGYPGGPAIATEAAKWKTINDKWKMTLPRSLLNEDNFDFSFSGLKTAVLRETEKLKTNQLINQLTIPLLAYQVQEAITDVLVEKTLKAVKKYKVPTLLVAGGVAANSRLREKFLSSIHNSKFNIQFFVPPPPLCTDNATMIGAAAFYNYKPVPWQKVIANSGMTITDRQ